MHNILKNGKQRADFNISTDDLHGSRKETIVGQLKELGCELHEAPLIEMAWYPRNN